jgi:hypothetical protein
VSTLNLLNISDKFRLFAVINLVNSVGNLILYNYVEFRISRSGGLSVIAVGLKAKLKCS